MALKRTSHLFTNFNFIKLKGLVSIPLRRAKVIVSVILNFFKLLDHIPGKNFEFFSNPFVSTKLFFLGYELTAHSSA